ncbi:hypothetical protein SAICODRAFT_195567 [Saitoella complicata NRRL Y-17804]|uniref:Uncharacterized protein n=1 Tax=Saitoella complicata (strain BCRC 22490 / CBS 7301 / JCM 7358 / NBRC 10748 / NRRL Y-17804) TaxID=698492 RepID=A0A0E9NIS5_SAICN|nr:uncharacterized protein SAICODRAFT_195567 [Saitoella complicata NRRL Y-17804]ODQ54873.1 hypothetical protein SAICODRAFT_195567 [Saitoella complicata NRRL Y-17804]GAO49772.1 hypothetical protein G7K_3914-t1 [Saitoella complicata NRRL Y-17804]
MIDRVHHFGLEDTQYQKGPVTDEMFKEIQTLLHGLIGKYYDGKGKTKWRILTEDHFPSWSPCIIQDKCWYLTKVKADSKGSDWSKDETERLQFAVEKYLDNPCCGRALILLIQ